MFKREMLIYRNQFEKKVMIPLFESRSFSKKIPISVRPQKLFLSGFGRLIGHSFDYDQILVFNYYGLNKFSTGFLDEVKKAKENGVEIKSIKSVVIYFSSIKLADISRFSPDLTNGFSEFKNSLVELRKFPKKAKKMTS
jgi:hypothetical protein